MISLNKSIVILYPQVKGIFPVLSQHCNTLGIFQKSFLSSSETSETVNQVKNVKPISEMPGPKSYPLVGNMFSMIFRKDFYQNKLIEVFEDFIKLYGPIQKLNFPGTPPAVLLARPNDIETLYRKTMDNPNRDPFHSLKKVRYEAVDNYFEKKGGLLLENNEEWYRVRSRVQTPMLKPKNIHRYLSRMDSVTLDFMERISSLQKTHGEMPANFQEELYKWALESVALVALNRRLGCLDPNLPENSMQMQLIRTVNSLFMYLNDLEIKIQWWQILPSPTFNKLKAGHELLTKIAVDSIKETEAAFSDDKDPSLLEILLQTEGLTRKDVVTFILDMLFAGIDTTSHSIAFTLYLLAKNPKAQKRLQEEIDSVLGNGDSLDETHLAKLSYLKACVKESFRIFPIVIGVQRLLTEDTVIDDYLIPKGSQVIGLNTLAGKDESVFHRATEFLPDRWMRDKPHGQIHPFASLPFSHGPRMCIGRRIAEQEMYIFLARIMHRFNVDYKHKDISIVTRFVSIPSEPLKFQFTERR